MSIPESTAAATILERPKPQTAARAPEPVARVTEQPQPQRRASNGADFDVVVVGSGPGGYVSAIRAAQLGLKVGIVEKGPLGGTCLNVGCIPTKAMLASVEALATARSGKEFGFTVADVVPDYGAMVKRRDKVVEDNRNGVGYLMKKNSIEVLAGAGKFLSPHEIEVAEGKGPRRVTAANVILATGSVCSSPPIPGSDLPGVVNSDQLLQLPSIPKSLVVIGAGAVGLEWGDIFHELGAKITVIEMLDRVLPPADAEVSQELARSFQKKGFDLLLGVGVKGIEKKNGALSVRYAKGDGPEKTVEAEVVLVATGRWPYTNGLGLEKAGVQPGQALAAGTGPYSAKETDPEPKNLRPAQRTIAVDEQMQTKVRGIYAIGDVTPGPQLAHVASRGGEVAAEAIAGQKSHMDYSAVPSCVYTSPEVAWVGLTEEQARERHGDVKVGRFPFRALGKARAAGYREGFIKVIADPKYGEILGVHMLGAHVTDLIAEPTLAMTLEATVEEIFHTVHAHPTLPEAFLEASLDSWGRAIHKG